MRIQKVITTKGRSKCVITLYGNAAYIEDIYKVFTLLQLRINTQWLAIIKKTMSMNSNNGD
jgi:hypothetical protein